MALEIPRDYLDRILRSLWQRAPETMLRLALGEPGLNVLRPLESQPVAVRRGVDGVALAEGENGPFVGHVEYETDPDVDELRKRLWLYGAVLHMQTGLPVRSAVLLLEPCAALVEDYALCDGPELLSFYRFRVLRLHQVPAKVLAENPDLAVLAPLGGGSSIEAVIRARDTILDQTPPHRRGDLLAELYIIGGRRFGDTTLRRIFTEEQLMQSSTYQATIEKGIERGIVRGREQTLRAITTRLLHRRFPDADLDDLLARCTADDLDAFAEELVAAPDAAALRAWLLARLG